MIVKCEKCKVSYDDAYRWTICPHETFAANDGKNNFAHHPESHLSPDEPKPERGAWKDDSILRMAEHLAIAWKRYHNYFGAVPHGSVKQLAALLELCPQAKVAIRLFEKQREEGMTV